jgi:tetratricopeptide (TPR) repeat protein
MIGPRVTAAGLLVLTFASIAVGAPGPSERTPADVVRDARILELEQKGQFEAAYQLVPAGDPRKKSLAGLLAILIPAADLERDRNFSGAKELLASVVGGLDPLTDQPLIAYVRGEIRRLDQLARAAGDDDARSLMAEGDRQMSIGDYSGADASFTKVVQRKTDISPSVFKTAIERLTDARRREGAEPSAGGVWTAFKKAAVDFLVRLFGWSLWVGYGLGLIVLLAGGLLVVIRVVPEKKETLLSLQDYTTSSPGAIADAALTEQLRREIALAQPSRDGVRVDRVMGVGGSSLGHAWLGLPLPALEAALQSNTVLSFGPFNVNPLQIVQLFQSLVRRRGRYELFGTLSTVGSATVFRVDLMRCPKPLTKRRWEETASGPDARARVIRAVGTQITLALDAQNPLVTNDWRSYRALRDGVEFLQLAAGDPSARVTNLEAAQARFQEAVLLDADNWLARLNLGDALRKLGRNVAAAAQFNEVLQSPRLPAQHRAIAIYNRAAALQKTDDDDVAKNVIHLLDEVLQIRDLDPVLERMARSGRLAAEADRLGRRRRRLNVQRAASRADYDAVRDAALTLLADGEELLAELESAIRNDPPESMAAEENNIIRAVVYNALGQLATLAGRPHDARDHCRRALTLLPSFVEAEINLAALYEEARRSLDREWATRADGLLRDVLALDPGNVRALVLLGKIYADQIFSRLDDAANCFRKALPDVSAAIRLGRVYIEQGKFGDAIAPLQSAASRDDHPGTAALLLASCALELPNDDRRRGPLLDRAAKWMITLGEEDSHTGRQAKQLASRLAGALKTSQPASDNALTGRQSPVPGART